MESKNWIKELNWLNWRQLVDREKPQVAYSGSDLVKRGAWKLTAGRSVINIKQTSELVVLSQNCI